MNDPLSQNNVSWTGRPVDFMQGERRDTGKIWHVRGWHGWSDRRKLRKLRELAEQYGNDPKMRWFVVQKVLMGNAQPRDYRAQAQAILSYVQNEIFYVNEPGEQIQSPWATLREKNGDCDDMAVLIVAMATSIGLPNRYVLAGRDRKGKSIRYAEGRRAPPAGVNFFHIYCDMGWPPMKPTTWAAAEPTIKGLPLGHDVVIHGMPDGARGGSDVNFSGMGDLGYAARVRRPEFFGQTQMPENGDPITDLTEDKEVKAFLEEQNPIAIVKRYGVKGLLAKVPWLDVFFGAFQGVVTAIAIGFFVDRRMKRQ